VKKQLFKEVIVWFEKSEKEVIRYRLFQDLSNEKFFVKSVDHFPKKLEVTDVKIYDNYFIDSLFENGITWFAKEPFNTIEEAISAFDSVK
jgi:hypothetical protein